MSKSHQNKLNQRTTKRLRFRTWFILLGLLMLGSSRCAVQPISFTTSILNSGKLIYPLNRFFQLDHAQYLVIKLPYPSEDEVFSVVNATTPILHQEVTKILNKPIKSMNQGILPNTIMILTASNLLIQVEFSKMLTKLEITFQYQLQKGMRCFGPHHQQSQTSGTFKIMHSLVYACQLYQNIKVYLVNQVNKSVQEFDISLEEANPPAYNQIYLNPEWISESKGEIYDLILFKNNQENQDSNQLKPYWIRFENSEGSWKVLKSSFLSSNNKDNFRQFGNFQFGTIGLFESIDSLESYLVKIKFDFNSLEVVIDQFSKKVFEHIQQLNLENTIHIRGDKLIRFSNTKKTLKICSLTSSFFTKIMINCRSPSQFVPNIDTLIVNLSLDQTGDFIILKASQDWCFLVPLGEESNKSSVYRSLTSQVMTFANNGNMLCMVNPNNSFITLSKVQTQYIEINKSKLAHQSNFSIQEYESSQLFWSDCFFLIKSSPFNLLKTQSSFIDNSILRLDSGSDTINIKNNVNIIGSLTKIELSLNTSPFTKREKTKSEFVKLITESPLFNTNNIFVESRVYNEIKNEYYQISMINKKIYRLEIYKGLAVSLEDDLINPTPYYKSSAGLLGVAKDYKIYDYGSYLDMFNNKGTLVEVRSEESKETRIVFSGSLGGTSLALQGVLSVIIPNYSLDEQWLTSSLGIFGDSSGYVRCSSTRCEFYYLQIELEVIRLGIGLQGVLRQSDLRISTQQFCPFKSYNSPKTGYFYLVSNCSSDNADFLRVKFDLKMKQFEAVPIQISTNTLIQSKIIFTQKYIVWFNSAENKVTFYIDEYFTESFQFPEKKYGMKIIKKVAIFGDHLLVIGKKESTSFTDFILGFRFPTSRVYWELDSLRLNSTLPKISTEYSIIPVLLTNKNSVILESDSFLISYKSSSGQKKGKVLLMKDASMIYFHNLNHLNGLMSSFDLTLSLFSGEVSDRIQFKNTYINRKLGADAVVVKKHTEKVTQNTVYLMDTLFSFNQQPRSYKISLIPNKLTGMNEILMPRLILPMKEIPALDTRYVFVKNNRDYTLLVENNVHQYTTEFKMITATISEFEDLTDFRETMLIDESMSVQDQKSNYHFDIFQDFSLDRYYYSKMIRKDVTSSFKLTIQEFAKKQTSTPRQKVTIDLGKIEGYIQQISLYRRKGDKNQLIFLVFLSVGVKTWVLSDELLVLHNIPVQEDLWKYSFKDNGVIRNEDSLLKLGYPGMSANLVMSRLNYSTFKFENTLIPSGEGIAHKITCTSFLDQRKETLAGRCVIGYHKYSPDMITTFDFEKTTFRILKTQKLMSFYSTVHTLREDTFISWEWQSPTNTIIVDYFDLSIDTFFSQFQEQFNRIIQGPAALYPDRNDPNKLYYVSGAFSGYPRKTVTHQVLKTWKPAFSFGENIASLSTSLEFIEVKFAGSFTELNKGNISSTSYSLITLFKRNYFQEIIPYLIFGSAFIIFMGLITYFNTKRKKKKYLDTLYLPVKRG